MSKITLKPLDDGQKAVEIPVGKTTIGRGPFLGCSDKKVSRNHAVLEVTSKGEVYLTPTHVNPCFYQPTADSPGQILKKDIPHKLENGDSFSLLPRAFRYQLIVTGENIEDKNDQNDLNKQAGKPNGATADCDDSLSERTKDNKSGKGISNEELNDGNTVTEKPFSKDDEMLANIDKSYSKEENTFAKKIADITDDSKAQCPKEDKEINEDKESEKEKLESNSASKSESSSDEKHVPPPESDHDNVDNTENKNDRLESKSNEACLEEKADDEKPKMNEKIVEENESTLGNDAFPKDKTENDITQSNEKSDSKNIQEKSDNKKTDDILSSNGDENVNAEASKNSDDEDEKSRTLPEWMESDDMPPPKGTKKRGPQPKRQAQEKANAKRKSPDESPPPPKTKGRRKAQKFTFDDDGEGSSQRNTPGRTSSRTNRQTRQGLSLEDFIVSDDDEWQSDRSSPKPRRKRGAKKRGDDSGSDWEVEHKRTKKVTHKFGSGSESGSDWGSQKKKRGPRGRRRKTKRAPSEVGSDEEVAEQINPETEKKTRIGCTYGKKCYRRNQNHLDQFSHPGDSDYDGSEPEAAEKNDKHDAISESEEEEGSKKECPFGANCFRKNPQHKKEFKHTKKVRPKREAAKQADKKTKSSRNSDDVDSYDLNDSLLNDDSDEYKPADSGSDYESGEKSKRFLKGKGAKNKRGKKV